MLIEIGVGLYLVVGVLLAQDMFPNLRRAAYVATTFLWPWFLCIEGTPRMVWWVRWARRGGN